MPDDLYTQAQVLGAEEPNSPVKVRRVPLPLGGSSRYQWRVLAVLTSLSYCRTKSASVEQLHTLVWALNDARNARAVTEAWAGEPGRNLRLRGYVPGLVDLLRLAQVEGLVSQATSGRQVLTELGESLLREFDAEHQEFDEARTLVATLAPISAANMWRRLGGNH